MQKYFENVYIKQFLTSLENIWLDITNKENYISFAWELFILVQ